MNKILNNVKKELCFITWIYEYLAKNLKTIEVDDKTLMNEFISSLWWLSLEDTYLYFENLAKTELKPHYKKVFFRELLRAISYIKTENKTKEVQNG